MIEISRGTDMKRMACLFLLALLFTSSAGATEVAEEEYALNPGDVLQITVWKEEGLDREVLVLPDGSVDFPLVGNISAKGMTTSRLGSEIKTRLTPYIPDAPVTVAVKAALGHAVSVIGQVVKPGELVVAHRTTVMQALSMAGGLTPYASHGRIIVLHHEGGQDVSIPFPYDEVAAGESLESNIVLKPGDIIIVPTASLF